MSKEWSYFTNSRPEMRAFVPVHDIHRILEIGCAAGSFIMSVPAAERWGVEPNSDAARIAAERGAKVLCGTYSDVRLLLPDNHFDLIVANDVIEHMPDHEEFLREIRGKLRQGGVLIGSVPNVRHAPTLIELLFWKDWRYRSTGVLDRTHLRFFTAKSLRRVLEACDFEVERIAGIGSTFQVDKKASLLRTIGKWLVSLTLIVVTVGHGWDTQYRQYGFRATPTKR